MGAGGAMSGGTFDVWASSLDRTGPPNSKYCLYKKDNTLKQIRLYDANGYAWLNIDFTHGGVGHTFPHVHMWDWSKKAIGEEPRREEIKLYEIEDKLEDWICQIIKLNLL